MSFSYPVTLNLKNRCCIVIGGGSVALRKVKSLL
ncbi:MAG: NAD(P)-dependent oxidoreductase, partial [Peptococcaceae bacterium]|nr:NAD(P)-dependent oxidoreductase [Peptococcaceae bacterium]